MNVSSRHGTATARGPHAILKKGWLAEQPAEFQQRLFALGHWKTYYAGQSLYEVGDRPNAVFGLEDGNVDIGIPISADELVTVHRAGPGFWIGDSALYSGRPRAVSVTAHTDCIVFAVPASALKRHIAERPEDLLFFYRLTFINFDMTLRAFAEVLALPPRARFARLLLRLDTGDGVINATQTELGKLAGMSRAAFRRSLGELLDEGIVRTEYGRVRIADRAALEAEAARA